MKRRLFGRSLLAVAVLGSACCSDSSEPLYKDVSQPVERRIDDLMGRMTLREKIGQMCQFVGLEHLRMAERNATPEEIRDGTPKGITRATTRPTSCGWSRRARPARFSMS